jgi:hypothetical protein
MPQQERRRLVAAARLTLLELTSTVGKEKHERRYFAKPGEAEWGCRESDSQQSGTTREDFQCTRTGVCGIYLPERMTERRRETRRRKAFA